MYKTGIHFFAVAFLALLFASCLNLDEAKQPTAEEEQTKLKEYLANLEKDGNDIDTTDLGVFYVTLKEGTGEFAKQGDTISVGYAGYFIDGQMFGSSFQEPEGDSTYTFILENPSLFAGWDNGMKVMKKNAKTQLIIPSSLAYGSEGAGNIPPYQTLIFVVIMKVIKPEF